MINRNLTEEDKTLLADWIAKEPDHKNSTPDFYYELGTRTVVYEDEEGPVFIVRYSSALRFDTDFNPNASRKRIAKLITEAVDETTKQAKSQGFKEIIFNSVSEKLINFCKTLGFVDSPDYRKVL